MAKIKFKKGNIQTMAGLVAGGVISAKISTIKLPISLPPVVQAGLPLVVGFLLMSRPGLVGSVGMGMVAVGGIKLVGAIAPKLGIGASDSPDDMGAYQIEGASDYALNGADMGAVDYALNGTSYALSGVDRNDNDYFG